MAGPEGKVIRPDRVGGLVVRLGRSQLVAGLDTPLRPLTNVRFRLVYPGDGGESERI